MKCPRCNAPFTALVDTEPFDGSITCTNCGTVFNPADYDIVDQMIKDAKSLRSLIITLDDGKSITLSFPNTMEPSTGKCPMTGVSWRPEVKTLVSCLVLRCFGPKIHIQSVKFDDEIEVNHDSQAE